MASGHGEDLCSGVYVSPAPYGQLVVTSPRLDLGWRVAEGILRLLSVLDGRPVGGVIGWLLRPLYRSALPGPG